MSEYDDLVKRLCKTRANMLGTEDEDHYYNVYEAIDAITQLQARVAELEELNDKLHHRNVELSQELYGSSRRVIRGYAEGARE